MKNIEIEDIESDDYEEEGLIDFSFVFTSLKKNKKLLFVITLASVLISSSYALLKKSVWEGQFEIVVAQDKLDSNYMPGSTISAITSLLGTQNTKNLKTEIEILKSPSVLMPVFNFIKSSKEKQTNMDLTKWRFRNWRNNSLTVSLQRGTTILKVSYRDTDQKLILPALKEISKTYQDYSGKQKTESYKKGLSFLTNQIELYRNLSKESFTKLESFAIENDLTFNQNGTNVIELPRINATNVIRGLEEKLNQFKNGNLNSEEIVYSIRNMPISKNIAKLFNELDEIESELAYKSAIFKSNNKDIETIKIKRLYLMESIRKRGIKYIEGKLLNFKAEQKAFRRPKEILIKYQYLNREAQKVKKMLNTLELEKNNLTVTNSLSGNNWELITKPTVLDSPIAPNKKVVVIFYTLISLFIGSVYILIMERKKDLIFSSKEISRILKTPLLIDLTLKNKKEANNYINLLGKKLNKDNSNIRNLLIIPIGMQDSIVVKNIRNSFANSIKNYSININNDYIIPEENSINILIISNGSSKRTDLIEFKALAFLQSNKIEGFILID